MAEVLAGALVCPIIKIVMDKASSCVRHRVRSLGDGPSKEALGRLEASLVQLQVVARAVERRGSPESSTDPLRACLQQLMDAVYEADDVLDDFDDAAPQPDSLLLRAGKRLVGADARVRRLMDVADKLDGVHQRSQTLLAAADTTAAAAAAASRELGGSGHHHRPPSRATGSLRPHEHPVFGRETELRDMVLWLVGESDGGDGRSVPVAAIMGQGGVGKTTLAQLLFEDKTVASAFDATIWVQPAAMDNQTELARQILQSVGVAVPDKMTSFDWLQKNLREVVSSRKFLLVIDDVWNREGMQEHEYRDMWSKVLDPLRHGTATGSKIVVTTRQKIVARLLDASKKVRLNGLLFDDIWSLFKRCAFGEEDIDKQPHELRVIGRKIADKLKGSPLAAKAVGQMLKGHSSVTKWRKVLEMNIFDNVSSTLELCYQNLPEHLQPCFAICSLFPKNGRFKRDKLVKIWMALGFIQSSEDTRLEDVGSDYFDQLVERSFFHRQKAGRRRYYCIHDLMHDLAEKVSRFDCARVEGIEKDIPKTVRHLSVSSDALAHLKSRCELKRLRTLLILKNPSSSLKELPGDLFTELKGLRVLGLEGSDIVDISGIGHLSHLRYIALCKSVTRLPQIVTKFYHLQTLSSPKGSNLKVPGDIVNLKRLRHLDMDTSKIVGIGKLVNLQGSIDFHVKKEKGHNLEDLNGMSGLRKELRLKNLDVVTSQEEACQAGLNRKENLKVLELEWNSSGKSKPSVDAEVLDGLEPHQHVKKLLIRRYHGNRSPNWLNVSFKDGGFYLKYLYLINCRKWEVLPPLGQLPCLKELHLKEMCSLKQIGFEFYGTNGKAFPRLEELEFDDMPQWVEWIQEENIDVFPNLRKLKLLNCPRLDKVPTVPLSVRQFLVENTGFVSRLKLSSSSSKAHKFLLDKCSTTILRDGLLQQQQVEAIVDLTLRSCKDEVFQEVQALTFLKRLQISHLDIYDEQLCTCLNGLQVLTSLEVSDCNNITSLPQIESPGCVTNIHELQIRRCSEFSSLHSLPSFVVLESILIENCPKVTVESFPNTFKSIRSLRKMSIMYCTELESLPSGLPTSLQVLHLIDCKPSLMNKLRLKNGPEWDKVACIPIKNITLSRDFS
ncbi:hypothetical protein ACP4OV_001231 [Aristida adscensionis]